MSESRKAIDARGKACPQPVILTKKALEEGGFDLLEVVVDNQAARENVARFAEYSGHNVIGVEGAPPSITIRISGTARPSPAGNLAGGAINTKSPAGGTPDVFAASYPTADPNAAAGSTVLVASDCLGRGNAELGALLMRGFIYALTESETPPARLILMNHGVRLATKGSESLDNLKNLEKMGVEILVCGTCLEFLKLKDFLEAGRVSNMYEIASHLVAERVLSV